MNTLSPKGALECAITKAGGQAKLAAALGITTQAISQWEMAPPIRVIPIERATGVPRQVLRPDLYPPEIADSDPSERAGEAA